MCKKSKILQNSEKNLVVRGCGEGETEVILVEEITKVSFTRVSLRDLHLHLELTIPVCINVDLMLSVPNHTINDEVGGHFWE